MNKKINKQQSLAGRIDKLGGPVFENHCYSTSNIEITYNKTWYLGFFPYWY